MRALWPVLTVAAVVTVTVSLFGHANNLVTLTGGSVVATKWPQGATVTYRIHNQTATAPNIVSGSNPIGAIDNAFAQASAATGLTFVNGGTTAASTVGVDGTNLVTFANTPGNLTAVGSAVAVAVFTYNTTTGEITESDIVFNPAQMFSTTGTSTAQDIESVAAHEVGHACGQEHSPICHATMFPFNGPGNTLNRTLASDDRAGLRSLYPPAGSNDGSVSGQVRRGAGMPVYGAHVVLEEVTTGRAISGGVTRSNGWVNIAAVPPGVYRVFAEPLDAPFPAAGLSGSVWTPGSYDTSFRPDYFGGTANPTLYAVKANTNTSLGALTVAGPAPTVDLTFAGLTSSPTGFTSGAGLPVSTTPGYSQYMVIGGPAVDTIPDSAFSLEGPFVSITGPSTLTNMVAGIPFKIFPISVPNNTPPGGYTARVWSGGQTAFMTGVLDVQPGASPQAWAQPYVTSPCAGSMGPVVLSANGQPTLGNGAFTMTATNTVGGFTGYLFLSLVQDAATIWAGCVAALDINALLIPFPGLPYPLMNGSTTFPTPVPNDPALQGITIYCQFAAEDPGAAQLFLGISNGLAVHIE